MFKLTNDSLVLFVSAYVSKKIAPSTCSAAGYTGGCCDSGNCFVAAGNCYCNASCHLNGNCCPDIADIGCAGKI